MGGVRLSTDGTFWSDLWRSLGGNTLKQKLWVGMKETNRSVCTWCLWDVGLWEEWEEGRGELGF